MQFFFLDGNTQSLDAGAMFGSIPRAMWSQWVEVDSQHRIKLANRSLLVKFDDGLTVLFETGIGAFFDPQKQARFGVNSSEHLLLAELERIGMRPNDIDAIVLSHLHFDHAGGMLTAWRDDKPLELLFPRAEVYISSTQWQRANTPHRRDRASFIPELHALLAASGRLRLVDASQTDILDGRVKLMFSDGHTPGLMMSEINSPAGPLLFVADLIPALPWVHLPVTMGYDRFPELVIDEKERVLADIADRGGCLYLFHDLDTSVVRISRTQKGGFMADPVNLRGT